MYLKPIIPCFLLACVLTGPASAKKGDSHSRDWGYDGDIGPEHWDDKYPMCGGDKQSPIDIITKDAVVNSKLDMIVFTGYESDIEGARLHNNGHTVVLEDEDTVASISGGGLPATYKFMQLHFHWGSDDDEGSEHLIDGEAAPLEMHIVHVNKKYGTGGDALKKSDGLAVLGILFELTKKDNEKLEPLMDALDDVVTEGGETHLKKKFDLDQLIPKDTLPYYRYEGSLTTPPCNEAVIWTVFKHKQKISKRQLEFFRNLQELHDGDADTKLEDNFRPPQPLNGRTVKVSIDTGDKDDPDPDADEKDDDDDDDDDNGEPGVAGQIVPSMLVLMGAFLGAIRRVF